MIHGDHSTVFMGKKHARNITCSVINSFQNVFVSASAVQKKHFSAVRFQNITVSVGTTCVYYSHEHFLSPRFQYVICAARKEILKSSNDFLDFLEGSCPLKISHN